MMKMYNEIINKSDLLKMDFRNDNDKYRMTLEAVYWERTGDNITACLSTYTHKKAFNS